MLISSRRIVMIILLQNIYKCLLYRPRCSNMTTIRLPDQPSCYVQMLCTWSINLPKQTELHHDSLIGCLSLRYIPETSRAVNPGPISISVGMYQAHPTLNSGPNVSGPGVEMRMGTRYVIVSAELRSCARPGPVRNMPQPQRWFFNFIDTFVLEID